MVGIKPGEKGVVTIYQSDLFVGYELNYYGLNSSGGLDTPNGQFDLSGYKLSWEPFSEKNVQVKVLVFVPNDQLAGTRGFTISGDSYDEFFQVVLAFGEFTVSGPLTGRVSPSDISSLQACVDLRADASIGQKVVSAVVDWGDGNSTTVSPAPSTQHYSGHECHTYSSDGTYTVTATYTDDASPSPNSISPTTSVTVGCINSASMSIQSSGSSNGKAPVNGIYTHCYTATVSHSTVAGASYSYDWIFPDNTTVNSGGGAGDQTASFCVTTANINSQSNFGVVACTISKTPPSPPCTVTVSGQTATPGSPPSPPPGTVC